METPTLAQQRAMLPACENVACKGRASVVLNVTFAAGLVITKRVCAPCALHENRAEVAA